MKKDNLKKLNNISIEGSGLINTNITVDPVYNFCVLNKLTNIGDFVRIYTYKLNNGEISKKHNLEYFDGIIDLLMLVYCGIPLESKEIFLRKIYIGQSIYSNSNYGYMKSDVYKSALRRLGLTNNEKNILLNYVACAGEEMTVIDAIKAYLSNDLDIKLSKNEQFIFLQKLKVFTKHYKNSLNFNNSIISTNLIKIEELLNKFERLLKTKIKLERDIINTEREMGYIIEGLSDSEIKQLQKKYPNKDFIAK